MPKIPEKKNRFTSPNRVSKGTRVQDLNRPKIDETSSSYLLFFIIIGIGKFLSFRWVPWNFLSLRWVPWYLVFKLLLVTFSWGTLFIASLIGWLAYDLPDPNELNYKQSAPSVTLMTNNNLILATYGDLYGEKIPLEKIPESIINSVLATEDRRFYSHIGIDIMGIIRAFYINFHQNKISQGGSTITQQLAKNIFLTPKRTWRRKGQEILLSLWLEQKFTKKEILELYLNRVYFGSGVYGIDAATRKFFNKPVDQISLFESAMLAGLLKAPARYNPINDPKLAQERARLVLQNMVDAQFITQDAAERSLADNYVPIPTKNNRLGAYFSDWILDQIPNYINLTNNKNIIVTTTLNPVLQQIAEEETVKILSEQGSHYNATQAALISMKKNGAIQTMIGGQDYKKSQFNRATQAKRQPGSSFKAFVFLTGFEQGLTPDTIMNDTPISIGNWHPDNYNNRYYGSVSLRQAFALSLNSIAVQISEGVGPKRIVRTAKRLGIKTDLNPTASIALGTEEVTLLELTGAYGSFANQGKLVEPRGIQEIKDSDGHILYQFKDPTPSKTVIDREYVDNMLDILANVVTSGTGKAAGFGQPAAGKTGTSQNFRDAWFIGFTSDLITGVWFGNDDYSPMDKTTGGTLPALLWHNFNMKAFKPPA
ncbi:MAG: PBP1A family penicillin-binding protein [Alphaproteobacteria bacterium]|nr:PBP1A family penicillin-binding protein [Alphaproteobacteria bacterium]